MEDSSMINMPNLVFDEKVSYKRGRDGEEEIQMGRLEKRPSGILHVSDGGDHIGDGGDEGRGGRDGGGGILDTLISNVFHKPKSGIEGDQVEDVDEDKDKKDDLGNVGGRAGDGEGEGESEGEGGGGIISALFPNIFQRNGCVDEEGDHPKSNHLHVGENDGGVGEPVDLNAEKLAEKKDEVVDLPGKDPQGPTTKLKPDDYAERVFFLNNN